MKLLFVNASLTQGGSEKAMSAVANQMAELGHDVTMLLVRAKPRTYAVDKRVNVIQLSYPTESKAGIFVRRLRMIRRYAKQLNPDCVISFMWDLNIMTLLATLGLHVRKVVSERSFPGNPDRKATKVLEQLFYRSADCIVYQTEMARDYCPHRLMSKSCVIPNIVSAPTVEPFRGCRSKRVVTVGRLSAEKNFSMLLDAFSIFWKTHPEFQLTIYGDGELKNELVKQANGLGIADRVEFVGYVDNVAECINDAAMFVLPSNYEGISNAMTEAMALGLPVICTDCPAGGAALMIRNGKNGLLVPVDDAAALTEAMVRVADDSDFALHIGESAKSVVDVFSAEVVGCRWEKVL